MYMLKSFQDAYIQVLLTRFGVNLKQKLTIKQKVETHDAYEPNNKGYKYNYMGSKHFDCCRFIFNCNILQHPVCSNKR